VSGSFQAIVGYGSSLVVLLLSAAADLAGGFDRRVRSFCRVNWTDGRDIGLRKLIPRVPLHGGPFAAGANVFVCPDEVCLQADSVAKLPLRPLIFAPLQNVHRLSF
jgi:hypothetical protein